MSHDGVERWFNLTVTRPSEAEAGEYLCVAENTGGMAERAVVLTFEDPDAFYAGTK